MAPRGYSRPWGKLICEKTRSRKSLVRIPLIREDGLILVVFFPVTSVANLLATGSNGSGKINLPNSADKSEEKNCC
jgi:hypothetical protein